MGLSVNLKIKSANSFFFKIYTLTRTHKLKNFVLYFELTFSNSQLIYSKSIANLKKLVNHLLTT